MRENSLKIATCQFPVCGDVAENARHIVRYIGDAASRGCHIVHFCETALTGYAGSCSEFGVDVFDLASFDGYDWDRLRNATREIMRLARQRNVCVVLGSTHFVSESDKPANCLYVISEDGRIRNRYDKRMCTRGDQRVYSSGNRLVTFDMNGVTCGLLICADLGSPELFHAYRRKGVRVLLHSFYNARFNGPIPNDRWVVPEVRAKARDNGMWIFANNSSARHSCWGTHVAGPDGFLRKLRRHRAGMLVHTLTEADMPGPAIAYTGTTSTHPRALNGRASP